VLLTRNRKTVTGHCDADVVSDMTSHRRFVLVPIDVGEEKGRVLVPHDGDSPHLPPVRQIVGVTFGNTGKIYLKRGNRIWLDSVR